MEKIQRFWAWFSPRYRKFRTTQKAYFKKYHIWKMIILASLSVVLIMSSYLLFLARTANVAALQSSLATRTLVFDENDNEAGPLYGQRGTFLPLREISPYLQQAVVSSEDRTFWTNNGIDPRGIARAAVEIVRHRAIMGGGSTITQQLAKNAFLTQEQTIDRKARELFLALELNRVYSKEQIMEMYLNSSYFGNGVWGVQDAANRYFGKNANELSIGEAAMLVGILPAPNAWNPLVNLNAATNRRNTVLQTMVETGQLTQEQANAEASVDLASLLGNTFQRSDDDYRFPSFFDAVIMELVNEYGFTIQQILTGGYRIYTTLNQDYQAAMQNSFAVDDFFPQSQVDGEFAQGASVAMNPQTGGIQALVGSRGTIDDHTFLGFNFATQMVRQPGSAIKPLVVFTPAVEDGYMPDLILEDKPQPFYPIAQNFSRTYQGEVAMYQAMAESLNLPVVYLLHKLGIQRGFDEGIRFGLPLIEGDKYYGLALGGLKGGVNVVQMAQAYTPFANNGVMHGAHLVRRVVDSTGRVVVNANPTRTNVMTPRTAEVMTSMMLGVMSNGTGVVANPPGFIMAGKTGTTETNWDATLTNDQWVIGYTPNVVIATWLGFANPSPTNGHYLVGTSVDQASQLFRSQASQILPMTPLETWQQLYPGVEDSFAVGGRINPQGSNSFVSNFQDGVDSALEGARDFFGDAVQGIGDGARDLWDRGSQFFRNQFGN